MFAPYPVFCPLLVFPVWFIVYSLGMMKLHYRDGRQHHTYRKPKLHHAKRTCALLLACMSLFNAIDGFPNSEDVGEIAVRSAYFFMYCIAWLLSFGLLRLEYSRGLAISWLGHRLFWPISFLSCLVCVSLLLAENDESYRKEVLAWPRVIAYFISCCLSMFLSCCGLWKPNDFSLIDWREGVISNYMNLSDPLQDVQASPNPELIPSISIQMDNFKKKLQDGKSVILYEVVVKVQNKSSVLWKSFSDFDSLQTQMKARFNGTEYPMLRLPQLPGFNTSDDVDARMQHLRDFLDDLNAPGYFCEEFLDFLCLPDDIREPLLKEHRLIMGAHGAAHGQTLSNTDSMLLADLVHSVRKMHTDKPVYSFFEVHIPDWHQSASQDGHIEYEIHWKLVCGQREDTLIKRFNDFYILHKGLKQDIAPARLPEFPSKTYLSKLIRGVDKEAVEYRRRALEQYLRHVLNDPAFLTPRLIDFIDCKPVTPSEIFESHRLLQCDCKLYVPIEWECEIGEDDEQFILYNLHFERAGVHWTVRRRFREFDALHHRMLNRLGSPALSEFSAKMNERRADGGRTCRFEDLPQLPKKALPLSTPTEIESRRKGLETYLQGLMQYPFIMEAFVFRQFIEAP